MKDKRIKVVKQQLKPRSIKDIQVFLRFANFYQQFIQDYIQIAIPFNLKLKIIGNIEFTAKFKKIKTGIGGNNIVSNGKIIN